MIVETGEGLSDSNSYVSDEYALQYHSDRGNDWQGDDALLVRATDYIDRQFGDRFMGFRTDPEQALEWPRKAVPGQYDCRYSTAYASDSVPEAIKQAVCDVAFAMSQETPETASTGVVKQERVEGVVTVEYFEPKVTETSGYGVDVAETLRHFIRPANRLVRV